MLNLPFKTEQGPYSKRHSDKYLKKKILKHEIKLVDTSMEHKRI